ncbi:hypothetical protein [Micromonospora sp. NPDC051141]|uniref:hypothetical protein n=1 Tax=Micromonospora sp. NPDC051141 TaxID=3364284 RepID=UPI00378E58CB
MRFRRSLTVLAGAAAALLVGSGSASAASGFAARDLPSFQGCSTLRQALSVAEWDNTVHGESQAPLIWNNSVCDNIRITQNIYVVDTATNSIVYDSGPRVAAGTQVQTTINFRLSPTQYAQLNSIFSRNGSNSPIYVSYVYANGTVAYANY